ncbi:VOC family protein [Mesobacillus subterraneus]|uniref:VOC family protein n=1 Tax=Mesobacillus subterraneus TaxID=285983 RepID=UPI0014737676|nr:VOC family protein [Mesobacillus subterraneus]
MLKKIEHVAIMASNLEESISFYTQKMGFILRSRGTKGNRREIAFLYLENDPSVEIELMFDLVSSGPYAEKGIVNHLAFCVEDMEKSISHFKSLGIDFATEKPSISIDGSKTIFLYGPNKELLQFVSQQ